MTGTQEFFKVGDFSVQSDERDIRTAANNWREILKWCENNNIAASRIITGDRFPFNIWRVKDDQQRTWFKLRWEI